VLTGGLVPHRSTRALALSAAAAALLGVVAGGPQHAVAGVPAGDRADGGPTLSRDAGGRVRLLAADGRPAPSGRADASAVATARAHLTSVAHHFGVAARELRATGSSRVAGRDVVRFQQTRAGLPVFAGQLVTVLDARGGLLSVSGETARGSRDADLTAYDVEASTAARTARTATAARHGEAVTTLVAERPTRWLLDRSLVDPGARSRLRPVWRVTVRSTARHDLRDLVLVDARTGRVALRLSEVAALDRVVCDDLRTRSYRCKAGAYDRVEGGPATGIVDADQAYDLTGTTAGWFAGTLGVDLNALIGTDFGDGRKVRSTTNYCPPGECPLDNAFWSGDQMVYGAGYTSADDVVAHELSHGVIQNTAGLVYWYQSGAINESMADVLGELVDQADGVGNDTPEVRWRLGEDLPADHGGVTRDMADPPRYGQPDTTTSTLYDLALDYDDNGAVHTNSGVPNKTAYLIADGTAAEPGGAFNGRAFPGIGTARTATLYWATLQMLTPGSDFQDLGLALQQSCTNLAFTAAECATVAQAADATGLARGIGPTEPRRVVMRGGPNEVLLSWSRPANVGSSPLVSYAIALAPAEDRDDLVTIDPAADGWVVEGLAPGVDYTLRLFAVSPDGTSPSVTRTLTGTAFRLTAPASVRWSSRVSVTGRLVDARGTGLSNRRVYLARRDVGTRDFEIADSVATRANGSFGFGWTARRSGRWFVLYQGASAEIGVRGARRELTVRQRVSADVVGAVPRPGQLLDLAGTVRPARDGRVALQRLTPDGWRTVARGRVADGRWTVSWRVPGPRPVDLRVRVGARPRAGLAAGTSTVLHLDPR
jgi:Zn-dependent metalloprotease